MLALADWALAQIWCAGAELRGAGPGSLVRFSWVGVPLRDPVHTALCSFCPGISLAPSLTRDAVTCPSLLSSSLCHPLLHKAQQSPVTLCLTVQSAAAANPLPSCPPALSGPFPPTYNLHSAVSFPCPGAGDWQGPKKHKPSAGSSMRNSRGVLCSSPRPPRWKAQQAALRPGALIGHPGRGSLSTRLSALSLPQALGRAARADEGD